MNNNTKNIISLLSTFRLFEKISHDRRSSISNTSSDHGRFFPWEICLIGRDEEKTLWITSYKVPYPGNKYD